MGSKTKDTTNIWLLLPMILLLTIFLFLARIQVYQTNLQDFFWFGSDTHLADLCAYFRMQFFLFLTAASIVLLLYGILCLEMPVLKSKAYIPILLYCVFVILSYFFSDYKEIAKTGFMERFEGTFVLLSYMLILFYAMNTLKNEKGAKIIFTAFGIACTLLSVWGVLQTMGIDVNTLPDWLFIPSDLAGKVSIKGNRAEGIVKWFFSNRNYASLFMVLPIPIFSMLSIHAQNKKLKIWYAALVGLLFYNLYGADSLGGMFAIVIAFLFAMLLLGFQNIRLWSKSIALVAAFVLGATALGAPKILAQLKTAEVFQNGLGLLKTVFAQELPPEQELNYYRIDYIKTEGNDILFSFEGNIVKIATQNDKIISVTDGNGKTLAHKNQYCQVGYAKNSETEETSINVEAKNANWQFKTIDNEIYFITPSNKTIKLREIEAFGFEGNETFGTNRGYIWSRTFPLLKETLLIGHGADTYCIYFPQDDYAGKYNVNFYTFDLNTRVDKPHNIYLGTAINTGVLSLVALLAIYAIYLVQSLTIYKKILYRSYIEYLGAGISISIVGYLAGGLVNDSTVQIAPVFYILLGMGFAINSIVKKHSQERTI